MARRWTMVLSVVGTLAALAAALLASPASAATEYHFKVFEKQTFQGCPRQSRAGRPVPVQGEDV